MALGSRKPNLQGDTRSSSSCWRPLHSTHQVQLWRWTRSMCRDRRLPYAWLASFVDIRCFDNKCWLTSGAHWIHWSSFWCVIIHVIRQIIDDTDLKETRLLEHLLGMMRKKQSRWWQTTFTSIVDVYVVLSWSSSG